MNILWISLCATLFIAFVDAQRNLNLSKPIINLEKRKPPTWHRPAEERRKLSIFPKTTKKYIVTPRAVVKPVEETVGLPTKRPLMRKFVVQDKNDKGSWYFAPREPLMKTKRFTVTVAPPRHNKIKDSRNANIPYDEIGEESTNVKAVITKPARELHKVKINKGNVVNVIQNEKTNFTVSKGFEPVEKVIEEAKLDNQLIDQSFKVNDVVKEESPELLSDNYPTNIRRLGGAKSMEDNHEVTNENERIKIIIESTTPFNTIDILSERIESRSLDSEIVVNDQNNDTFKIDGNFNGLQPLLDIFVNESHKFSENTPALNDGKINTTQNEKDYLEDLQRVLAMGTNNIQEVNSLGNNDDHITEVSQTLAGEDIIILSETGDFDDNKTSENTLSMDGLQPFIDFIKTGVIAEQIMEMNSQIPILLDNQQHLDTDTIKESTTEHVAKIEIETSTNIPIVENINLSDVTQPSFFKAINNDSFENPSAEELIVETDNTNHLSQENSPEICSNESDTETSDEFLRDDIDINSGDSNESKIDRSNKLTGENISNDSLVVGSNTLEEDAIEKIQDVSNNLTIEDIVNDSNMADEESSNEASNESFIDKSNNLTAEDITKETIRDVSNDLTVEDVSIDSNVASGEISNESEPMSDKIITSESLLDISNNLTIEDITKETNISGEEISNESASGNSSIQSEEVFNDSLVIEFTGEKHSEESVHDKTSSLSGEDASEFIENIQNFSADEIPVEAIRNRYKRSNNIIEEEHQATERNIFKYTGQPTRLSQDLSFKNINA